MEPVVAVQVFLENGYYRIVGPHDMTWGGPAVWDNAEFGFPEDIPAEGLPCVLIPRALFERMQNL